jgi:hypothetical protein
MKEVEPYDLSFENHMQHKKKCSIFFLIMHVCQQVDECVPYEKFASQMRELNDEQRIIVDDILCKKNKTITHYFNMKCNNRKTYTVQT